MASEENTRPNLDGWRDLRAEIRELWSKDEDPFQWFVKRLSETGVCDEADITELIGLNEDIAAILYLLDQNLGQERRARLEKMGDVLTEEFSLIAARLIEAAQ
jgi:hypothetical protein